MTREEEILQYYSTPGLRKNALSRNAKRNHLAAAYKMVGERANKILDEMYGPETEEPT